MDQGNYVPLWKTFETPLVSLDASHVEMFSLLCLFLLCLVALVVRKRRQMVRHLVQVVSILVFFYIVYSCLGVFGMIRNMLHGVTLIGTVFTEAFFWMSLPVVVIGFSLVSGPYFCGWICPTGTIQEFIAIPREYLMRRLSKNKTNGSILKPTVLNLTLLFLFFAGFVGSVFWLGSTKNFYVEDSSLYWASSLVLLVFLVMANLAADRAIRVLRGVSFVIIVVSAMLKTAIVSPVHFAFADVRDPASALTTLIVAVASLFITRAWCRYVCPFGYLMGRLHLVSRLRVTTNQNCARCNHCRDTCRVEAITEGQVNLRSCQLCLACVDQCPQHALEVADVWKKK